MFADSAMSSVSGFTVEQWQTLWRDDLKERYEKLPLSIESDDSAQGVSARLVARVLRLAELLTVEGHPEAALSQATPSLDRSPHVAALRYSLGRAAILAERQDSAELLGTLSDVEEAHAGWLALRSRILSQDRSSPEALELLQQANSLDPLLPEVACAGLPWVSTSTFRPSGSRA